MYVTRLEINNFRCFEETAFELNYPGRKPMPGHAELPRLANVNLFLGDNGSGKSSVFKALALGVLAPIVQSLGISADFFVRRKAETGNLTIPSQTQADIAVNLTIHASDVGSAQEQSAPYYNQVAVVRTSDIETIASTGAPTLVSQSIYLNNSPSFFFAGYGANRRSERPEGYSERSRSPRYQRVAGLFEEHVGLAPFTYAYLQIKDRGWLDEARAILNTLLPADLDLSSRNDSQNRPLFSWNGIDLPFTALSDGYRAFIGWVWDLLFQLASVYPFEPGRSLKDLPGVVVVDEIDLFLHPEWQRTVVQQVGEAFPNLQFLFSTHSPLVAGTLEAANIYVLEGDHVEQYREEIYGLPANQVLTSSYFGLNSTRAPGTGTLTDLAKFTLGIQDDDALVEQAEPADDVQPAGSAREIFRRIATQERADMANGGSGSKP